LLLFLFCFCLFLVFNIVLYMGYVVWKPIIISKIVQVMFTLCEAI
jgi:hypothetical protein